MSRMRWMLLVIWCGLTISGCRHKPSPSARAEPIPLEIEGLHNVFRVSEQVYSGSGPEGEAAFASLARLGIRTIISVDGARPEVELARKHGLRYVHLPFGYEGIPRERVVALARVASALPGPFYLHCHHGKHRGPAAVAAMLLCANEAWDRERAEAWLRVAGTSPRYTGLVSIPATLVRPTAEELETASEDFAAVIAPSDATRVMVEMDARWERLSLARAAGWTVPEKHPDIDPPHEALLLVESYREAARLGGMKRFGPRFAELLGNGEVAARELESALRSKPLDRTRVEAAFTHSGANCTACHDRFRDRPANAATR